MLSYRHGFHAGNHADVLKHTTLVACLRAMRAKETPLLYVDTHAGAGSYALREGFAAQNDEWAGGVERLAAFAGNENPPPVVADYLAAVIGPGGAQAMERYPGSPAIAAAWLRPQDRLALFELHPSDYGPLSAMFSGDRRARVVNADGFSGLRGTLPPPSRRALVLIDPSYELAADYECAIEALREALRRFATGVYAVWYPLLERPEAKALPRRLMDLAAEAGPRGAAALDARLRVRGSRPGERGMAGSGLVVFNPPWRLADGLREALPYLARALGDDADASWDLETRE